MKMKNVLPVTSARKNIFSLLEKIKKGDESYTFTRLGKPAAVLLSVEKFEKIVSDKNQAFYFREGVSGGTGFCREKESVNFFPEWILRDRGSLEYLSRYFPEKEKKEKDFLISRFFAQLVQKHHYPLHSISTGHLVRSGKPGTRRYIEADLLVRDERGKICMIVWVSLFSRYEKERDEATRDLFDLAELLFAGSKISLVHYSADFSRKNLTEKIAVIRYPEWKNFSSWERRGKKIITQIPAKD